MVTNFITSKYATSKLGKGKSKCKKNNLPTYYLPKNFVTSLLIIKINNNGCNGMPIK